MMRWSVGSLCQLSLFICLWLTLSTDAVPTVYKRNDNYKLEPVLIPVSSTVIPLPVYKVGAVLGITGDKPLKPPTDTKLVTLASKKAELKEKEKQKEKAKVRTISQEDFFSSKDFL